MAETTFALRGRVCRGLGQGATFTELDWVRAALRSMVGIEPAPGTLNIELDDPSLIAQWGEWRAVQGLGLTARDPAACDARVIPATINGERYAAIIVPEVANYPAGKIELVCARSLREDLSLSDGDEVTVNPLQRVAITAAIFDVDGTLLNSLDGYLVAVQRAVAPHGYSVTPEMIRHALNGGDGFWQHLLPVEQRDNASLIAELRDATMAHWPSARDDHVDVIDGATELLDRLTAAGVPVGICTGSMGESFPPLARAGLLDRFGSIVTAEHVARRKPDPEGIVRCLAELGVAAESAIYVGDSVVDVEAARAAGAVPMGVLTGAADSAQLTAHGVARIAADIGGILDLIEF